LSEKVFTNTGISYKDEEEDFVLKEAPVEDSTTTNAKDTFISYRIMEELLELLTSTSMNAKVRLYMRDKHHLLVPIFGRITNGLSTKIDEEYELYSSVLILFANLFIKETGDKNNNELKRIIIKEHSVLLLKTFGSILRKSNKKFLVLKKSTCAFLSNLL